ncbi:MAG: ATPase [Acidimicrobiales bacterium]
MSTTEAQLHRHHLEQVLGSCGPVVVACSGDIDSLVLATVAHLRDPATTVVAHTVTPAVPGEDTARVLAYARRMGWHLEVLRSLEFEDERYLSNPTDRCYFCKSNLYDAVAELAETAKARPNATIVSGANIDDLGEYRPGLKAASEHDVRHPFVEAGMGKAAIRELARRLDLADADLPASPCLASRLYTGTRVTETRLRAIEVGEAVVRTAGMPVARCRLRDGDVLIEVPEADRPKVTGALLDDVATAMRAADPQIGSVVLDQRPYRPGQAVLGVTSA